jgi:hypothetical protein
MLIVYYLSLASLSNVLYYICLLLYFSPFFPFENSMGDWPLHKSHSRVFLLFLNIWAIKFTILVQVRTSWRWQIRLRSHRSGYIDVHATLHTRSISNHTAPKLLFSDCSLRSHKTTTRSVLCASVSSLSSKRT